MSEPKLQVKMVDKPRVLTIVIETACAEDCRWIWDSHKDYILKKERPENDPNRYGVTVVGLGEGDKMRELLKLEEELDKKDEYIQQLECENRALLANMGDKT